MLPTSRRRGRPHPRAILPRTCWRGHQSSRLRSFRGKGAAGPPPPGWKGASAIVRGGGVGGRRTAAFLGSRGGRDRDYGLPVGVRKSPPPRGGPAARPTGRRAASRTAIMLRQCGATLTPHRRRPRGLPLNPRGRSTEDPTLLSGDGGDGHEVLLLRAAAEGARQTAKSLRPLWRARPALPRAHPDSAPASRPARSGPVGLAPPSAVPSAPRK